MKLLVLTDIWGIDPAIRQWIKAVTANATMPYEFLSPYPDEQQHLAFTSDQNAYASFSQHGGLENYTRSVRTWFEQQTEPVLILGFSAGAAVAFQLATELRHPAAVFAVYGGQIHRMSNFNVLCPTQLVFSQESHFDVNALVGTLKQQHHVCVEYWPVQHGFANPRSAGYDRVAQAALADSIARWLDTHQPR